MAAFISKEDILPLFKTRDKDSNKSDFGYVGIMGGCPSYSGAVKLANLSMAALKSGCGVARLIVPGSVSASIAPYLLESTLFEMPCDMNGFMRFDRQALDNGFRGLKAASVGMGWGQGKDNGRILSYILREKDLKLVIDADGINTLAGMDRELISASACRVVLTPHVKEFSRISGLTVDEIKKDPKGACAELADRYSCIVLLKGAITYISDGNETLKVDRGCPGMATAGSGDVLSGILTGLMGYLPCDCLTVAGAAYLAGLAGEMASDEKGEISMTASDTISKIGKALAELA